MAHIHTYIVLHPRHKLAYFKNARWEDDWVTTAEKLVRDQFALYSDSDATNVSQDNHSAMETSESPSEESHKVHLLLINVNTDY